MNRFKANTILAVVVWLLGLGTVFSFNLWSGYQVFGFTFFDFLDFLTANIMLPISGLLIALFVGFVVDKKIIDSEMLGIQPKVALIWRFALRYLAPLAIGAVFIMGFYDKFF